MIVFLHKNYQILYRAGTTFRFKTRLLIAGNVPGLYYQHELGKIIKSKEQKRRMLQFWV